MKTPLRRWPVRWVVALMTALPGWAVADGPRGPAPEFPLWRTECGSCHVAYPPRLLPAREWKAVMGALDRHYGSDASLAPASVDAITAFLERYAGPDRFASGANPPRVTTSAWFKREHREIAPSIWSRSAVGTPANCSACHPGADTGRFDEHSVRIPR